MKYLALAVVALVVSGQTAEAQKPPSKTMKRATSLYLEKDYDSASIELSKVLSGETADDSASVARAGFFLAKTLYQLEFYTVSAEQFNAIVNKGVSHPYYDASLRWIVALARVVPVHMLAGGLGAIESRLDAPINEGIADEARLALVRLRLARGNIASAEAIAKDMSAGTHDASRAQLAIAIAKARSGDKDGAAAAARAALAGQLESEDKSRAHFELGSATGDDAALVAAAKGDAELTRPAIVEKFYRGSALGPHTRALWPLLHALSCDDGDRVSLLATTRATLAKLGEFEDNSDRHMAFDHLRDTIAGRLVSIRVAAPLADVAAVELQLERFKTTDEAWQTTRIANSVFEELTLQQALTQADAGLVIGRSIEPLLAAVAVVEKNHNALRRGGCSDAVAQRTSTPVKTPVPAPKPAPRSGCAGCSTTQSQSLVFVAPVLLLAFRRRRRGIP